MLDMEWAVGTLMSRLKQAIACPDHERALWTESLELVQREAQEEEEEETIVGFPGPRNQLYAIRIGQVRLPLTFFCQESLTRILRKEL